MKKTASVTIVVHRNRVLANGKNSIYLRFYNNQGHRYHKIGLEVDLKFWDFSKVIVKKTHPEAIRYNNLISLWVAKSNQIILERPFIDYDSFIVSLLQERTPNKLISYYERYSRY